MIVVFGTICVDRVRRVPYFPTPGSYVEVQQEILMLGGEAANTANALNAWGVDVRLQGNPIGVDEDGNLLRRLLAEHGLPLTELCVGPGRTPICDVYVTDEGDRTLFGLGFSDMDIPSAVDGAAFVEGGWFTVDPNMSAVSREAARRAHRAGMKLYLLDFIRADEEIPAGSVWQSSTVWAGKAGDTDANLSLVSGLAEKHGCLAILTDSHHGFVAAGPDLEAQSFQAHLVAPVVDSTGAGDVFRAGMLFGLDREWPVLDCLRYASAAGTLACRSLGATSEVASVSEVLALAGLSKPLS